MSINYYGNNYAFVASTLPIHELNKNIKKWEINEIVVASEDLLNSYKFLIENFPNIKLKVLPESSVAKVLFLSWRLFKIKINSNRIYFFHECCWVLLDILISLIRPKGNFYPQVSMIGNPIQEKKYLFKNLKLRIFTFFWFNQMFNYHKFAEGAPCFSLKKYPKSIEKYTKLNRSNLSRIQITKKILFIVDIEFRDNTIMIILQDLINLLVFHGYECQIKDHPRASERLNISSQFPEFSSMKLDSNKPVELLNDDYLCAIGLASVSLLFFGRRAVSILNLTKELDTHLYSLRKNFLKDIPGGDDIRFIDTIDEVLNILQKNNNE
jgi:hypothetical protein